MWQRLAAARPGRRWIRPLFALLALLLVLNLLLLGLPRFATAVPHHPVMAAHSSITLVPAESPTLIASLIGTGQVGPDGVVVLLATLTAGAGEMLTTLEASASGGDGQWQTLATLATPGPVTLLTGFNPALPTVGTAVSHSIYLRASDANGNRSTATLVVTIMPTLPTFGDVPGSLPVAEAEAIRQMAARGVILGYANGNYGPDDSTQRAQMAALIARAMGYGGEDWGNTFADRGGLDPNLWRNVGTLQHYQVALGYDGAACAERNVASPCFAPTEAVTKAQTISFITRAMVARGFWQQRAGDSNPFPNVPVSSGHIVDLATFAHYIGAPPGATVGQNWSAWTDGAMRGWFAQVAWLVVQWLERAQNWATFPTPPFAHRAHGIAVGARLTNTAPRVGDAVTVSAWIAADGRPVAGAAMTAAATLAGNAPPCEGTSDGSGWASCQLAITQAMAGQTVAMDVIFAHQGASHTARVILTVPEMGSPSPRPSNSPSPSPSVSPSVSPHPAPSPAPSPSAAPSPGPSALPSASPSLSPNPSPTPNRSLPVGPGFSDVSPHQLVRTGANVLYAVVPTCDAYPACPGATLRVYRGDRPGTPTGFSERDTAHRPAGAGTSAIAIDGADRIHALWVDRAGRAVYAVFDTAADIWGPHEVVDATGWTDFGQGDEGTALALDAAGVPHAAWSARGPDGRLQLRYASRPAGGWAMPARVDDAPLGPNRSAWHPTLAFAPDGALVLAWLEGSFNYTPDGIVRVRERSAAGLWGPSSALPDAAMTAIDNGPSLIITANGVRHLTFLDTGNAIRYWYDAGQGWRGDRQPARQVTHNPALGPDGSGGIYIYGHGAPVGSIGGHGDNLYRIRLSAGATAWGPWDLYVTGAFDSSVSTRWSQFFHHHAERVDILYWADPYPNLLYLGTE